MIALDFYETATAGDMQTFVRDRGKEGYEVISSGATSGETVVFWAFFRRELPDPDPAATESEVEFGEDGIEHLH